jgi:hypothetical protein
MFSEGRGGCLNQEYFSAVGLHQEFFGSLHQEFFPGDGGSSYSVKGRGQRERGSGGSSPLVEVPLNLQMNETLILIRLLWMYIPRNWEFGSVL